MTTKAVQKLLMPSPKLNQLYLLQLIARNPHITQAELARSCMLSVAMVNNYMKEFSSLGFLEYRRRNLKSISYYLTEAGKKALEAIGHEFVLELVSLFADIKARIRQSILNQTEGKVRRVVLHGSGDLAELAFHALESADIRIVGVCDETPAKQGRDWCGREMLSPNQIRFLAPDAVVVANPGRTEEICQTLSYLKDRGIRLIRLDDFDVQPARSGKSESLELAVQSIKSLSAEMVDWEDLSSL